MTKKAQVIALPTEKVFDIRLNKQLIYHDNIWQFCRDGAMMREGIPQHLYFVTDDEIKEDDWCVDVTIKEIFQAGKFFGWPPELKNRTHKEIKKIVATTNPDLWYTAEQRSLGAFNDYKPNPAKIPTDFIEAYVREKGNIKEVMLEYYHKNVKHFLSDKDRADLPKVRYNGTVIIHPVKSKVYTRDEVKEIGLAALSLGMDIRQNQLKGTGSDKSGKELYYEWFDKHYPG